MTNPFAILSLEPAATKREILTAVTAALRAGRLDARAIAEAQKTLFDPLARAVAEFEHSFDACARLPSARPEPTKAHASAHPGALSHHMQGQTPAEAPGTAKMPEADLELASPEALGPRHLPRLERLL